MASKRSWSTFQDDPHSYYPNVPANHASESFCLKSDKWQSNVAEASRTAATSSTNLPDTSQDVCYGSVSFVHTSLPDQYNDRLRAQRSSRSNVFYRDIRKSHVDYFRTQSPSSMSVLSAPTLEFIVKTDLLQYFLKRSVSSY